MKTAKILILPVTTLLLVLGACKNLDGSLVVNQNIAIVNAKGVATTVASGSYAATIGAVNSKKGVFEVTLGNNSKANFNFPLPQELRDKNYAGPLAITAAQSGQSFDVRGVFDVQTYDSAPYNVSNSCVAGYENVQICQQVQDPQPPVVVPSPVGPGHGPGGPGHGDVEVGLTDLGNPSRAASSHEECHMESRAIGGRYESQVYDTNTDRRAEFSFVSNQANVEVAQFRGSQHVSTVTHTISSGPCYAVGGRHDGWGGH